MAANGKLDQRYAAATDRIEEGFAEWFNLQRRALIGAGGLDDILPATGDERYHLVDLPALYRDGEWELAPNGVYTPMTEDEEDDAYLVTMVNGMASSWAHAFDNGAICMSLREATLRHRALVEANYNAAATDRDGATEPLAAINSAFMRDGIFIYIPDGVRLEHPILVESFYAWGGASFPRIMVVAGRDSQATVAIIHRALDERESLVDSVCEVVAGPGARVNLTTFSSGSGACDLLHGNFVLQHKDSKVDITGVTLGTRVDRIAHRVRMVEQGAQLHLYGLYLASGDARTSCDVRVDHAAAGCNSMSVVKGLAGGCAEGSFTGRVYVAPGAQRTEALQQSRNIEASPGARIFTRPQLEIYADDVRCSHGATVGQMDSDAIFYMRQRGLDVQSARRLQLEGFVRDITSHVHCAKEYIEQATAQALEGI